MNFKHGIGSDGFIADRYRGMSLQEEVSLSRSTACEQCKIRSRSCVAGLEINRRRRYEG